MPRDRSDAAARVPRAGRGSRAGRGASGTPRLKELAEILGVSPTAVSMALNGRPGVSDELRARVRAVAEEYGYRPHYAARALRVERSNMLGLVNRNLSNPGYLSLIDGFTTAAEARGYQVLVGNSNLDRKRETTLLRAIATRQLDGLAIAPLDSRAVLATWHGQSDRPLVLINATQAVRPSGTMGVRSDATRGLSDAVAHLTDLGHRRIALLTNRGISRAVGRAATFRRLMSAAGVPAEVMAGATAEDTKAQLVERLSVAQRPTAYVTDSDLLAHQVYDAAAATGLRIPEDLSVVGFDDLPTSRLLQPALTTLAVDRYEIGRLAATMLVDTLDDMPVADPYRVLPATLVVRSSTAPPPAGRGAATCRVPRFR